MSALGLAVVTEARAWLETRYHEGQHAKGVGADCFGLVLGVGLVLGFRSARAAASDPLCKGYGRSPDPVKLDIAVGRYLVEINRNDVGLGDLYLMRWKGEPHHFAIISQLDPMYVIHSYVSVGKVCETPISGEWRHGVPWSSLIVRPYRYQEVAAA